MRFLCVVASLVLALGAGGAARAEEQGRTNLLPEGINGLLGYPLDYGLGVQPIPASGPMRVGGGRNDRLLSALFHNGRGRWPGGFNRGGFGFGRPIFNFGFFGGYPGFGYPLALPAYGYPFYPPLALSSPETFWSVGLPYGYLGYPSFRPQPPAPGPYLVDASQVIVNPPSAPPADDAPPAAGERYYLDLRSEPARVRLVDAARRQLRVELAEPGSYLVRWTGPTDGLRLVEFQSVDAAGQVLGARLVREAPFRGLLRVPEKTAAVLVTLEQDDGSSASVKLPVGEFKALSPAE